MDDKEKNDTFIYRKIKREEAKQGADLERLCFPPHEACTEKMMVERIQKAPELFLVAEEKETGKLVGFLSGLATHTPFFSDDFFKNADLYEVDGKNIMLLGLVVLENYRQKGIAKELMRCYVNQAKEEKREALILTCLEEKVKMYEKMGFHDQGLSRSTWGGEVWHEMKYEIKKC